MTDRMKSGKIGSSGRLIRIDYQSSVVRHDQILLKSEPVGADFQERIS